ncbi:glycine--tRNA ligase subunit beta [Sandaracinobacter sp.]|uniref:glycine--tRNA ligase subunit beta n=1 Tax=Sandaracinobacter sp. TaxID=2487581 RepID=UPI0035B3A8AC
MADFLLELFSEEIPARMQPAAAQQLREKFGALLAEAGLKADAVETHATPRRLALIARGLPAASEAVSEERRGPRADAPAQAIEGFLKSTGLSREQLEERDTGKGVFLFANLAREGRPAAEILAAKLPALIAGFQWPKSQRWGRASQSTASPRWVRPLRAIVALLDGAVVEFEALGLQSGRETFGHRFMGGADPVSIDGPATYEAQLKAVFVILSAEERRRIIREGAETAAAAAGLKLRPDDGLEAENAGLTEWPVPLLGRFDPAYLEVPPEIIQLTMRTNQKYFAVEDAEGNLAPGFVCVANLVAPDGGKTIVAGNERVLSARLSDAKFFWTNDRAKPLESFGEKLQTIVFHEKLGTMAEKVERVAKLARWLVETYPDQFPGASAETVERAARLAKADLTTGTVGEFPELQGIIGGYLAGVQGKKPEIVAALKQHYVALSEGDVPVAVALADRLDTLVSFFGADIRPTGSKDPFGLRRASLSIISMIQNGNIRLSLESAIWATILFVQEQYKNFMEEMFQIESKPLSINGKNSIREILSTYISIYPLLVGQEPIELMDDDEILDVRMHGSINEDIIRRWEQMHGAYSLGHLVFLGMDAADDLVSSLIAFLADRLKVQQREAGVRHDLIDAVFALGGEDDLVRLLARVKALQAFVETDDGKNLIAGYKRAANILKAEEKKDGVAYALDLDALDSPYFGETEKNLAAQFARAEGASGVLLFDEVDELLAREDFEGAMKRLSVLRAPVDRFFEDVTVNDPDPAVRKRRLGLLAGIRDAMHRVADFSKLEG